MGHQLYNHPRQLNLSTSLAILPGAKAYFYVSGTSTPATVYQNASLTTPHAVPVVADAAGVFAPIYLDSSVLYKVELQDTNGAVQSGYPVDPCNDLLPQSGNTLTQVTGTNTIEGTLSPDQALVAGLEVTLIPVATNTGAVTLELNSSGAVLDVLNNDGSALSGSEMAIGIPAKLILDSGGDDWILTNPQVLKSRGLEVGYRGIPVRFDNNDISTVAGDAGGKIVYNGTGGHTVTVTTAIGGSSTLLGVTTITHQGTGSAITISPGAASMVWFNGSGTIGSGSRTLAIGGECQIECDGTNFGIRGFGLT